MICKGFAKPGFGRGFNPMCPAHERHLKNCRNVISSVKKEYRDKNNECPQLPIPGPEMTQLLDLIVTKHTMKSPAALIITKLDIWRQEMEKKEDANEGAQEGDKKEDGSKAVSNGFSSSGR